MRQLIHDENILKIVRKWSAKVYPQIVDDLAAGRMVSVEFGGAKSSLALTPSIPWLPDFFAVVKPFFARGKNLLLAHPKQLADFVDKQNCFMARLGYPKPGTRNKDVAAVREYCKALFSFEDFAVGRVLVPKTGVPNRYVWQMPPNSGEVIDGRRFIESLHVKVCPYCNARSLNLSRAFDRTDIDHYFPHAYYPCLGISLYNLVPSCTDCNRKLKKAKIPDYDQARSPYDSPDYHEEVGIIDAALQNGQGKPSPKLESKSRKGNGTRADACQKIVDYLGYYADDYRREAAAVESLYRVYHCCQAQNVQAQLPKADRANMRNLFRPLTFRKSQINHILFCKLDLDLVKQMKSSVPMV